MHSSKLIMMRCATCAAVLLISLLHLAGEQRSQPQRSGPVRVLMHNITYHFTDRVAVHISDLSGELLATAADSMPVFDDKKSFVVKVESAEISMPIASLVNVLNTYVFAAADAPVKDLSAAPDRGKLKIKGKLAEKGNVQFELTGSIAPTEDGKIRLHAEKVRALHLPVKGLMDLLGIKLADLIKTEKVRGVRVDADDLILDPQQFLPPPALLGKITAVSLRGDEVVQTFGNKNTAPPLFRGNYMAYHGNLLRFGKLTMNDTDMILIDMDPKDPFDFNLDHYREQLVAGYTKETPSFGLRVYMRDFNKLRRTTSK